jgi:segregation and condensation protein B
MTTTDKPLKLIIEALVFASDKPLSVQEIQACLPDETLSDIRQALDELKAEYDQMARSFIIREVAQGFQFRTLPDYSPYILRMFKAAPTKLSKAAMETLAIIAYKQPILRHEIERLRGVDAGGILRTLMEKGLIKIVGRKNLPGKPLIYGTSKKFLEVFDLKDIESLPKLKEIKDLGVDQQGTVMPVSAALPDEIPGEEDSDETVGEEEDQE